MLHFVLGTALSGKTEKIFEIIGENIKDELKRDILLIPEQASFFNERKILSSFGERGASFVSVLGFSRLYDEVCKVQGGAALKTIDDCGRILMVNSAIKAVADELSVYRRQIEDTKFASFILSAIDELRMSGVTSKSLRKAAESIESAALKQKISDIALILDAFETEIGSRFIDEPGKMDRLLGKIKESDFFKGKRVYIDGFKGFTGQQIKILKEIISTADEVYISLCTDSKNCGKSDFGLFSNINNLYIKLSDFAEKSGVKSEDIILDTKFIKGESIKSLEKILIGEALGKTDDSLKVFEAQTPFDEAEFTAKTIHKLARQKGYRYRDFVVIARNTDGYRSVMESAFRKYDIPLFFDNRQEAGELLLSVFCRAALRSSDTLATEDILRFLKTSLSGLGVLEIAELENYTYLWNISGKQWLEEWILNPEGLKEESTEDIKERLRYINELRERAIASLKVLRSNQLKTVRDYAEAMVKLFEVCSVGECLNSYIGNLEKEGSLDLKQAVELNFDIIQSVLDQMVTCMGERSVSRQEFAEILRLSISASSVGGVPQNIDEVVFGSADKIRPSSPKITFVLGVNSGVFPMVAEDTGIFNTAERRTLNIMGIELDDHQVSEAVEENFLLYRSLISSTDELYVSWHRFDDSFKQSEPSSVILSIGEWVPKEETHIRFDRDEIESKKQGFEVLAKNLKNGGDFERLKKIYSLDDEYKQSISSLERVSTGREMKLKENTAKQLFRSDIYSSATKVDMFHKCRFSYFCRYGLGLEPKNAVRLNNLQRGTVVHFVLEKVLKKFNKDMFLVEDQTLRSAVKDAVNEYISLTMGDITKVDGRILYTFSKLEDMLCALTLDIRDEFKRSEFVPVDFELKIKDGEKIPALKVPFDSGKVILTGSVDRVDICDIDGKKYVRIVDYKTGQKIFKLSEILYGLNLQMLIYLAAITENGSGIYDGVLPAGVLYKPSKKAVEDSFEKSEKNPLKMNGLVLEDEQVLYSMDKDLSSLPVSLKKDGTLSKTSSVASSESFDDIFRYIKKMLKVYGENLHKGNIQINPLGGKGGDACKYCDFAGLCFERNLSEEPKMERISATDALAILREGDGNGV